MGEIKFPLISPCHTTLDLGVVAKGFFRSMSMIIFLMPLSNPSMYFLEKFSDVAFTTGNITDVSQHSVETTATPRMVAGPGTVDGKAVRGHLPWDAVAQLEGAGRRLPNSTLPQSMAGAPPHPCAGNLTNQEGGAGAGAVGDLLVHTDAALEAGVAAVHEEQAALLRTGELPGVLHDEGHEALRDELRHAGGRGNRNPSGKRAVQTGALPQRKSARWCHLHEHPSA